LDLNIFEEISLEDILSYYVKKKKMDIKFLNNHSNGELKMNGNAKSKNESKKSKYGHVITDEYKMTEKSSIEEVIRSKKQSLENDSDLKRKRSASNDRKQSIDVKIKKSKKSKTILIEEDDEKIKEFESKHKISKEKKKKSKPKEENNEDF